jgi:glucose/arabinose dehydrogenase
MLRIVLAAAIPVAASPAFAQQPASGTPVRVRAEPVASGLDHPWAIAFLPDGRLLVTERPGRLRIVSRDGKISDPIDGLPRVAASGQGGLLDVILDRDFAQNRTIYMCFADPVSGGSRTALSRARLNENATRLTDVRPLFLQDGPLSRGQHFGCRIVQMPDGNLMLTMGDHYYARDEAQNLANHIGKIVRIAPDGSIPKDNPFVGRTGARPEIWSYGHRNSQGAALNPATGKLWMSEHGPRGGDEINIPEAGKNYGWPVIGYGIDYSGAKIHEATHKAGMEQPVVQWTPVIAASGLAFYTGDLFPAWKGNLFAGGLRCNCVVRLELDGDKVVSEERIPIGQRVRDVRAGPDGAIWVATDASNGQILRLVPAR